MDIRGHAALVTGGGSGLGAATARMLAQAGAKVALLDVNQKAAAETANDIDGIAIHCDVADAPAPRRRSPRPPPPTARRASSSTAPASARRSASSAATGPMALADFDRVVRVNLIGTFNAMRLAAVAMAKLDPLTDDERGVIVCTASVAAFDGQIGQAAYSSSKGGVVGARAARGARIRPVRHPRHRYRARHLRHADAAGPLGAGAGKPCGFAAVPEKARRPGAVRRPGAPHDENRYLNGEVVRLDASLRMAPK